MGVRARVGLGWIRDTGLESHVGGWNGCTLLLCVVGGVVVVVLGSCAGCSSGGLNAESRRLDVHALSSQVQLLSGKSLCLAPVMLNSLPPLGCSFTRRVTCVMLQPQHDQQARVWAHTWSQALMARGTFANLALQSFRLQSCKDASAVVVEGVRRMDG